MTGDRVLWLTPDKPADVSVGRRRIADHLREDGVEVTLRGTTPGTVRQSLGDAGSYDAVVGTTRAGAIAGALLRLLAGTPLVVDHVDPIRQFTETASWPVGFAVRWLEHLAFAVADHVVFVYDEEESRVSRFASSWSRTDLGVEFERFAEPSPAAVERARDRFEADGVAGRVAIYVGGLEPIYHVEALLDAVGLLDDWSLVVLGDGSLAATVRAAAAERDDVVYPGTVPHEDVPGFLHAADVGVSLVDDPHTLKVLEYGAAGLPVVQLAGRAEARFGGTVDYCDPSPAGIAGAIERAGGREPDGRLAAFASGFDWAKIAVAYREALKSVI